MAQQQTPTSTIKKDTELVSVPVIVTDKAGHPVSGLKKDEFVLLENGKLSRPITSFEEVETTPGAANGLPKMQPGDYTNFAGSLEKRLRITIIVLDMINTPFVNQAQVKSELIKFLARTLKASEPTALLTIGQNGVKQIFPFTNNTQLLITALRQVSNTESNIDVNAAQTTPIDPNQLADLSQQIQAFQQQNDAALNAFYQQNAIRDTLSALEEIAHAYSGLPGRKVLLWASAGFPFMIEDRHSIVGTSSEMLAQYERTWRALNSANIAMYPVDALGLANLTSEKIDSSQRQTYPPYGLPFPTPQQRPLYNRSQEARATMNSFAAATGGKPCLDRNDLSRCFEQAVTDSDSYYLLTYSLPEADRTPGWHKLKVSVNRKDVRIRARSGFYVPSRDNSTAEDMRAELKNAFSSPLDYTGLQLFVHLGNRKPDAASPGKVEVPLEILIAKSSLTIDPGDRNHISFAVAAVGVDQSNRVVADFSKTVEARLDEENAANVRQQGLMYQDAISVPSGKYTVKVVVRDNLAGKIGSLIVPLEIDPIAAGR